MPLVWIMPKRAFSVRVNSNSIPVYHVYKDDMWEQELQYWYTFEPPRSADWKDFDVRMFMKSGEDISHATAIQRAIDDGRLRVPKSTKLRTTRLYKTTIVIWSDTNTTGTSLEVLTHEAMDGVCCSYQDTVRIDVGRQVIPDGVMDFFGISTDMRGEDSDSVK